MQRLRQQVSWPLFDWQKEAESESARDPEVQEPAARPQLQPVTVVARTALLDARSGGSGFQQVRLRRIFARTPIQKFARHRQQGPLACRGRAPSQPPVRRRAGEVGNRGAVLLNLRLSRVHFRLKGSEFVALLVNVFLLRGNRLKLVLATILSAVQYAVVLASFPLRRSVVEVFRNGGVKIHVAIHVSLHLGGVVLVNKLLRAGS